MIQYMQLINQLNDDNADWSFSDENFQLFKQYNQISFSSVDYELKSRAVARTNNMARWQQNTKKLNVPDSQSRTHWLRKPRAACPVS